MTSTLAQGQSAPLQVTIKDKNRIQVGISWDTGQELVKEGFIIKKEKLINVTYDIDLFCCVYNADKEVLCAVTPENASLMDPSEQIFHSGDNQTGRISGDDEFISVNTALLPENYESIIFFALSHGKTFKQVNNSEVRVADGISDTNQLHLDLNKAADANKDGFIFVAITRDGAAESGWTLKNISTFKNDADVSDWGAEGAAYL